MEDLKNFIELLLDDIHDLNPEKSEQRQKEFIRLKQLQNL